MEYDAAPAKMTFARLGVWDDKPYMVIMSGESVELPADVRKKLNSETDPTWPHVHARIDASFEEFLNVFPSNHVLGVAGDHVRALTYLCEIAGITPIILGTRGKERLAPVWERVASE